MTMTAVQFAEALRLKAPATEAALVTNICSLAPFEAVVPLTEFVFDCRSWKPAPAVTCPVQLAGNPTPANAISPAAAGTLPLLGDAPLPCALAVWSTGLVVLAPWYS